MPEIPPEKFLPSLLLIPRCATCAAPSPKHSGKVPGPRAAECFDRAQGHFQGRDYPRAKQGYQDSARTAEREGDRRVQMESYAVVARCFSLTGDLEAGRPWLAQAEEHADPEEPLGWSRTLLVRGIYQRESGKREQATATFEELFR